MLRKLKWRIPGEPLAAQYNWCQGPILGRGQAFEKHCSTLQTCIQSTHSSSWGKDLFSRSTTATSERMPLWLLEEYRDCSGLRWYWQFASNCRCL